MAKGREKNGKRIPAGRDVSKSYFRLSFFSRFWHYNLFVIYGFWFGLCGMWRKNDKELEIFHTWSFDLWVRERVAVELKVFIVDSICDLSGNASRSCFRFFISNKKFHQSLPIKTLSPVTALRTFKPPSIKNHLQQFFTIQFKHNIWDQPSSQISPNFPRKTPKHLSSTHHKKYSAVKWKNILGLWRSGDFLGWVSLHLCRLEELLRHSINHSVTIEPDAL